MPFPTMTGTHPKNLSDAWNEARSMAQAMKDTAIGNRAKSLASTLISMEVITLNNLIADCRDRLNVISALPGIVAYAQQQVGDNAIDIPTAFSGMLSAMTGVTGWVITNFFKDASGFLLGWKFNADNSGRLADRVFSAAETAGYRTALDALLASLE